MKKIRVFIVEDSPVICELLRHIINQDPRLVVAAVATSAEKAMAQLHQVSPDIISMDVQLPGIDGLEATQRIMQQRPTPIVIVSGTIDAKDQQKAMKALRAGALCVVEKPVGPQNANYRILAESLCTKLTIMSQVKLVQQRFPKPLGDKQPKQTTVVPPKNKTFSALGIVASTGGPSALVKLLSDLSVDFPLPIFLVQHIITDFLPGFVRWLNDVCPFDVRIASYGEKPKPGTIYTAPPDHHLECRNHTLITTQTPHVCVQRPSGTVLFQSMAQDYREKAIGVLLTGMGEDGADGLLALKQAGSFTLAEDKTTAVVYGMPAAAMTRNAVCESLPLNNIADRIQHLVMPHKEPA